MLLLRSNKYIKFRLEISNNKTFLSSSIEWMPKTLIFTLSQIWNTISEINIRHRQNFFDIKASFGLPDIFVHIKATPLIVIEKDKNYRKDYESFEIINIRGIFHKPKTCIILSPFKPTRTMRELWRQRLHPLWTSGQFSIPRKSGIPDMVIAPQILTSVYMYAKILVCCKNITIIAESGWRCSQTAPPRVKCFWISEMPCQTTLHKTKTLYEY